MAQESKAIRARASEASPRGEDAWPGERCVRERDPLPRLLGELKSRFGNHIVAANALALLIASWAPRCCMVRSGVVSGQVEHLLAFGFSGALMFAMLAERHAAWRVAAGVVAYAGLLELGQMFVSGRHAALADFCFSAAGAIIGVLACAALRRLFTSGGAHE